MMQQTNPAIRTLYKSVSKADTSPEERGAIFPKEKARSQVYQAQPPYRLSPGGHVVLGKYPGGAPGYDPITQQYQLALAAATKPPPPPPARPPSSSSSSEPKKPPPTKQPPYALQAGKPFGPYMPAQLTKPHQTAPDSLRPRKGGTAPEDVFRFPDDDEERNSLRRAEERQKSGGSADRRPDKEADRQVIRCSRSS